MSIYGTSTTFSWAAPLALRRIESGVGSLSKLPEICKELNVSKPLIVTGTSIATKTDIAKRVQQLIPSNIGVHAKIGEHAPIEGIRQGLQSLKEHDGDGIIALGGGSPIDAAKAIIHLFREENRKTLPLLCIPTTLSAAEMTSISGYTENGKKVAVQAVNASAIIYDAELSLQTPNRLWLSTGIRAVDHAVEQQCRKGTSIPIKSMAREAAGILFESLRACAKNAKDVDARQRAFVGATMSLWPDSTRAPIGPSHTIGYQIGSPYSIPHGICSCITLAAVIRAVAKTADASSIESLAALLSHVDKTSYRKLENASAKEQTEAVALAVQNLLRDLQLESTLAGYKVPKEDIPGIVERGLKPFGKETSDPMYQDILKSLEALD